MIPAIAYCAYGLTAAFATIRLLRGPKLADRVVAVDVALISLMCGIATHAAVTSTTTYLNLLVVIAIVGFTATVAASRYIENQRK